MKALTATTAYEKNDSECNYEKSRKKKNLILIDLKKRPVGLHRLQRHLPLRENSTKI